MVDKSELVRFPIFAGLPDDQIDWFIGQSQELRLKAGENYSRQGDPADAMFVLLEGQLQGRGEVGGEKIFPPKATPPMRCLCSLRDNCRGGEKSGAKPLCST